MLSFFIRYTVKAMVSFHSLSSKDCLSSKDLSYLPFILLLWSEIEYVSRKAYVRGMVVHTHKHSHDCSYAHTYIDKRGHTYTSRS